MFALDPDAKKDKPVTYPDGTKTLISRSNVMEAISKMIWPTRSTQFKTKVGIFDLVANVAITVQFGDMEEFEFWKAQGLYTEFAVPQQQVPVIPPPTATAKSPVAPEDLAGIELTAHKKPDEETEEVAGNDEESEELEDDVEEFDADDDVLGEPEPPVPPQRPEPTDINEAGPVPEEPQQQTFEEQLAEANKSGRPYRCTAPDCNKMRKKVNLLCSDCLKKNK